MSSLQIAQQLEEILMANRPASGRVSKRRLAAGFGVGELGVLLDTVTTPVVVRQVGLNLEANAFSRLALDSGLYLTLNVGFMLFLLLLSYMVYRYASSQTATTAAWGFLLLGVFRGFFGFNNLLILSGLHPFI